jgi:hypothetical protein
VDLELVAATAAALPQVEFVLVGPTRHGVSLAPLRGLANVRHVGAQPYADVPSWIAAFDVCLIPFKHDHVSAAADPLKFYEYCALGKPVVTTHLPAELDARDGQGSLCYQAGGRGEFAAAILRASGEDDPQSRDRRRQFARDHTWLGRAQTLVRAVSGAEGAT